MANSYVQPCTEFGTGSILMSSFIYKVSPDKTTKTMTVWTGFEVKDRQKIDLQFRWYSFRHPLK